MVIFVPGQRGIFFDRYAGTDREYYSCFSVMLALCLHKHKNEHIAPIMFPPFSLDPIGFGVVGPMGTFFVPSHFTFLRARFAPLSPASGFPVSSRSLRSAQSRTASGIYDKRVPSFFALASLPTSLKLRRTGRSVPTPSGRVPGFSFWWTVSFSFILESSIING